MYMLICIFIITLYIYIHMGAGACACVRAVEGKSTGFATGEVHLAGGHLC